MRMNRLFTRKSLANVVLILLLLFLPILFGLSNYFLTLLVMMCIYIIASLSLNLLLGYGGQVSVGNGGFLMIGAYASAIFATTFGLPFYVNILLAGIVSAIVSLLIGLPSVRLRGHFLAVITLGFGISIPQIALNWEGLTNGYSGMFVTKPSYFSDQTLYIIVVIMTVLIAWIIYNIINSRLGRAFVSIRESEIAAQSVGINVAAYKLMMFSLSAFFTGIAGSLYAYWIGFVSPNDFTLSTSFLILAMIVVGGLASIKGSIIGAVIISLIPHYTDQFIGLTNLIIGVFMALIILLRPAGIASIKLALPRKHQKEGNLKNVDV